MKRMTSIKLPVSAAAERDTEGFIKEDIKWQEAIPGNRPRGYTPRAGAGEPGRIQYLLNF